MFEIFTRLFKKPIISSHQDEPDPVPGETCWSIYGAGVLYVHIVSVQDGTVEFVSTETPILTRRLSLRTFKIIYKRDM